MASTYVNDLRLNEMATGDASGTWGTITNTNLELIGEALGYGTQDCFTSDADATTTVADGATDPARAMYFKVTSSATLTATRTLTIAPNTVSRLQFIENATTGSQSINISQGSGANVTIGSGETKAVYLDGAGSGAAVVDAFGTFHSGNFKITGNLNVDGGTIKLDGNYPTGTNNVALGNQALDSGSLTGGQNVAIGTQALTDNTSGTQNTAVGSKALDTNTTGSDNVAVGYQSLFANTTADDNTAVGYNSLLDNTTGTQNVSVGRSALANNTTGNYNVGIGYVALGNNTTASANTALGFESLLALTTGNSNVAIGYRALKTDTLGDRNVAVGNEALSTQNFTSSTDSYNVGVGYQAGKSVTTGIQNTLIGGLAGDALTDADYNVGMGMYALSSDTLGSKSTAIGYASLYTQNFTSATDSHNTAVGYNSGYSVTTGIQNTLIGSLSGDANTTGGYNTAIGKGALGANTEGNYNNAFGTDALDANTSGSSNNAMGYRALTAFNGSYNTSLGHGAGQAQTSGDYNTYVGAFAGNDMTTGAKNTIIGAYQGNSGGLDIRTSSNNIVLSDGDGNPRLRIDDSARIQTSQAYGNNSDGTFNITENLGARACISLRSNSSGNSGNFVLFTSDNGNNAGEITHTGATSVSYSTTSDYRLKNNVTYTFDATTRLKQLKPARFSWNHDDTNTLIDGFLAHEVQSVVPEAVNKSKDAVKVWKDGEELPDGVSIGDNKLDEDGNTIPDYQTIDMSKIIPLLVKAVQELSAKNDALEARIATLEGA